MLSANPPGHPTTLPKSCSSSPGDPLCQVLAGMDHFLAPSPFLLTSPPPCDEGRCSGGVNWGGCNGDAVGMGRKGARSCCTSRGQRCGEGRRRIRGEAERGEQERALDNFISRTRAAGRPLRTAGLLLGCCCVALRLMRHLLRLTACICCRLPPPAKLPAAAARRARPPSQPGAPGRRHLRCPGHPQGRIQACSKAGITLPREGKHPEMPCK